MQSFCSISVFFFPDQNIAWQFWKEFASKLKFIEEFVINLFSVFEPFDWDWKRYEKMNIFFLDLIVRNLLAVIKSTIFLNFWVIQLGLTILRIENQFLLDLRKAADPSFYIVFFMTFAIKLASGWLCCPLSPHVYLQCISNCLIALLWIIDCPLMSAHCIQIYRNAAIKSVQSSTVAFSGNVTVTAWFLAKLVTKIKNA